MAIGFDILDAAKQYTLLIRRGVGELAPGWSARRRSSSGPPKPT